MDIHWHAAAAGELLAVGAETGDDIPVGFAAWEDARECLLFAVVDRLVTVPSSEAGRERRHALVGVAADLEAARPGWRWSCQGPDGTWWLLVCNDEHCGCEVLHGPVHAAPPTASTG